MPETNHTTDFNSFFAAATGLSGNNYGQQSAQEFRNDLSLLE